MSITSIVYPSQSNGRYRPEIDGLRAFAVIAVIINHFSKDILPGGFLGVDIFFVISGFVITSSLSGRSSKNFKAFIIGFFERRIKRLVPALSVFVLIASIAVLFVNSSPGTSLKTGLASLFGLSNLYLLKLSTSYFAQSTEYNVFVHTWSLGVEEQFYFLFPFLIWFTGYGRHTKNGTLNFFLVVGSLTIASLILFLYLYPTNQPAAYFFMPSRFWEIAAGCLTFIASQKQVSIHKLLEIVPPFLPLGLILAAMYLPISFAALSTIVVVFLSSVLIFSLRKNTAVFLLFTNSNLVYIGLISYSLYLWHWGVLSISRWTIGIHWWTVPFLVALMLGLATASYQWIETPVRKANFFGKPWSPFLMGGVFSAVTVVLIFLLTQLIGKFAQVSKLGKPISTQGAVANSEKCMYGRPEDCLRRNSSLPSVFAIGDSHLMNYVPSMRMALFELDREFYAWGGAKFIREIFVPVQGESSNFKCASFSLSCVDNELNQLIEILEKGRFGKNDILVYSSSRSRLYLNSGYGDPLERYEFSGDSRLGTQNQKGIALLGQAISKLSNYAIHRGGKVVLIDDIPVVCSSLDFNAVFKKCSTSQAISISDREPLTRLLRDIASSDINITYVDPHPILCKGFYCESSLYGIPLYADNSPHLSIESKLIFKDFFKSKFQSILSVGSS
jgi:peptidoglycan/LPS O-acetylase OafA/YrhL